jgi:hypothetical protein
MKLQMIYNEATKAAEFPSLEQIAEHLGLDIEYCKQILETAIKAQGYDLVGVQVHGGYSIDNLEYFTFDVLSNLAAANFVGENDWGVEPVIHKLKKYSNTRWIKAHYKLAIKLFKIMTQLQSDVVILSARGTVKASGGYYGEPEYKTHRQLLEAFVRKGVLEVKYLTEIEDGRIKESYEVTITDLGKTVFDSELRQELARVSQEGMEYYFQVMDMIKTYLSFFKVNTKGIPEYKA